MSELSDWVVSTACVDHDAQNGLKWGLAWLDVGEDATKRLHIAIESLRNGYDLLLKHLPTFLMDHLHPVDSEGGPSALRYEFWVSLGVEPSIAEELTELGLLWRDGRLEVST